MPRVQFYHNAEQPLALACELTARAFAGGRRVAIRVTDDATAGRLDQLLWTFEQLAFIPHVSSRSPLASKTPVLIDSAVAPRTWAHHDLLFNLAADIPSDFAEFRGLIEIIGQSEADKAPARARWTHYKQHGFDMQAFDAVRRERL